MALIVLPEKLPTWRTAWMLISPAQSGEEHAQLSSAGILICDSGESFYSKHIFWGQVNIAWRETHSLQAKLEKKKNRTKVPFLETDHIEYTFQIIQMAAWLSCSESTLFSQVTAGISSTVYPFRALCFNMSSNLGFVKVSWKQRGASSLISWGGPCPVRKVPFKEMAMMPSW